MNILWATKLPLAEVYYGNASAERIGRYRYVLVALVVGNRAAYEWLSVN